MKGFFSTTGSTLVVVWSMFLLLLPESSNGQSLITGFTLINAVTDQEIDLALNNNGNENIIDLASVGDDLSLRADVATGNAIGSVGFQLDGQDMALESFAPFALGGDTDGDYKSVTALAVVGSHTVTATAYSAAGGDGSIVDTASITLEIVDSNPSTPITPATSTPTATVTANDIPAYPSSTSGTLSGELMTWHKITIGFQGPATSETNTTRNPFTDYRLDVVFVHNSMQDDDASSSITVPGYYAADGNAANSQATAGNVWLVHWAPDQVGLWAWTATFTTGTNVALQQLQQDGNNKEATSAGYFDGATGSFNVTATDKEAAGRDHRGKGRLQYVGEHHLQFAESGDYFLKAGADSPENFLAYNGFDNTPNNGGLLKSWSAHAQDFNAGDPTWASGKGAEIIGAINYLSAKGVNAFSFLTMNIAGDDANVFPYISDSSGGDRQRIDVSKTAQWEVVLEHGDHMGMYLHFKTQETENDQLLDGGALGNERKLYYRELVARFGHHLALNWNIGEENTNSDSERKEFATFFKQIDPYDHPIVIHTYTNAKESVYSPLLGYADYDGVSLQANPSNIFSDTLEWRNRSAAAGRKWVVANDEQGDSNTGVVPDVDDPSHDTIRKLVLWGNIMAGGGGVEYYFGYSYPQSDLTCQDFRSRDKMWDQSRYALEFFNNNSVAFWEMTNANELVTNGWCLAQLNGDSLVIYLNDGGSTSVDLTGPEDTLYSVKWYDPRSGGPLQDGSFSTVAAGSDQSLGSAPSDTTMDWVILLRRSNDDPVPSPPLTIAPIASETSEPTLTLSSHPDIVKIVDVPGEDPGGLSWADSYSVGDECFCASTFDHNIGPVEVETPLGTLTVLEICSLLGPGPGLEGNPIYNDVNCGNGPANDAGDEDTCPGRVDIGRDGCGHIGPPWNFSRFLSSVPTMPSPATLAPSPPVTATVTPEPTLTPTSGGSSPGPTAPPTVGPTLTPTSGGSIPGPTAPPTIGPTLAPTSGGSSPRPTAPPTIDTTIANVFLKTGSPSTSDPVDTLLPSDFPPDAPSSIPVVALDMPLDQTSTAVNSFRIVQGLAVAAAMAICESNF